MLTTWILCAALTPAAASVQHPLTPRPVAWVQDIAVSEETAGAVAKACKATLLRGLETFDWDAVRTGLHDDCVALFPRPDEGRAVPDAMLSIVDFDTPTWPRRGPEELVAALRAHVEAWTVVERTKFKFFEFLLSPQRASAFGRAHFMLAGPRADHGRAELHASVRTRWRSVDGTWLLEALELESGHALAAAGPRFRDVTDATGFHFNESAAGRALNARFVDERHLLTVGGVSACDWNRDGFPDLLATRREQDTVLFLNDGRGGFVRGELPLEVPSDAGYAYLFLDLDGDAREELVGTTVRQEGRRARVALFTRPEGPWERRDGALELTLPRAVRGLAIQGIATADIDGDRDLDLFFAVHSDSRSGLEGFNTYVAEDGGENLLFVNEGELRFREESEARGIHGRQYTFVAGFFDFDGDGDPDLIEGNDWGPNRYYENDGSGHFELRDAHLLSGELSYTMGITLADWDNTGRWGLHLSNMYSHAGNRIAPLATNLEPAMRERVRRMGAGNQLFVQAADGSWVESAASMGIDDAGWAWASLFFDLDNDGDRDLFVTNGYTSNSDPDLPDW